MFLMYRKVRKNLDARTARITLETIKLIPIDISSIVTAGCQNHIRFCKYRSHDVDAFLSVIDALARRIKKELE